MREDRIAAGPAPAPHRVPAPDDVREPCPPLKIYVATSLDHAPRAVAVHKALEHAGHIITYRWTDHGSVQDQGVARLREVAEAELNGVRDADVLVAILPGGRGTHAEIGIAIGLGIPVVLLEQVGAYDAECAFYHAPGVHRYMWSEESVLPLLAFWAESVWLASRAPDAPHSIRDHHNDAVASWSRATSMLEDATIDLALARDTCINAGIPGAAVDAEGNTIPWGLPALVQRLAEQSAMHQDARSEAESAARTHLDEVDDLRKQLKARSRRIAELERNMLPPGLGEASLRELAKKADAVDDARQILMDALDADTSPASLRSFPGEAAILGVARMAAAQLRHHRLPLAEQLAACRVALTDRINALDLAADLLGVA